LRYENVTNAVFPDHRGLAFPVKAGSRQRAAGSLPTEHLPLAGVIIVDSLPPDADLSLVSFYHHE